MFNCGCLASFFLSQYLIFLEVKVGTSVIYLWCWYLNNFRQMVNLHLHPHQRSQHSTVRCVWAQWQRRRRRNVVTYFAKVASKLRLMLRANAPPAGKKSLRRTSLESTFLLLQVLEVSPSPSPSPSSSQICCWLVAVDIDEWRMSVVKKELLTVTSKGGSRAGAVRFKDHLVCS